MTAFQMPAGSSANGEGVVGAIQFYPNRGAEKDGVNLDGTIVATFSVPFKYE